MVNLWLHTTKIESKLGSCLARQAVPTGSCPRKTGSTFLWACLLSRLCCSPFNCSIFLSILLSSIKQYQTNKTLTSLTRTQEVEDLVQPSNRGWLLQPVRQGFWLVAAYVSGVFDGRQPSAGGVLPDISHSHWTWIIELEPYLKSILASA